MNNLPLSIQFQSECYNRYLIEYPDLAQDFALSYFEQYAVLAEKYQKLQAQNKLLKSSLKKAHLDNQPSLPKLIGTSLINQKMIRRQISLSKRLMIKTQSSDRKS